MFVVAIALLACEGEFSVRTDPSGGDLGEGTELPEGFVEDRFVQFLVPASDVLFVVDNSCSMANEQAALGENFSTFLDAILESETDIHVGVVSTDMSDPQHQGRLRRSGAYPWVDLDTPDPAFHFGGMVSLGTAGDPMERGREAAFAALETRRVENFGFLREQASLHVVVVSDEDDDSSDDAIPSDEFVEYLRGLKFAPYSTTFSSVVGPEGATLDPYASCSAEYGAAYIDLTRAIGGREWSICRSDWGPVLAELGAVASGLRTSFFLTRRPVAGTLEVDVEIDGEVIVFEGPNSGWLYDERRNQIALVNYVPPEGAEVIARYEPAR